MSKKEDLKKQILDLTREYYREVHGLQQEFVPGKTKVNYAGNLLKHPAFDQYVLDKDYRVVGDSLPVTDSIMNDSFWIGVYPGMSQERLQYMIDTIRTFVGIKRTGIQPVSGGANNRYILNSLAA